jgi:hypothetical protein
MAARAIVPLLCGRKERTRFPPSKRPDKHAGDEQAKSEAMSGDNTLTEKRSLYATIDPFEDEWRAQMCTVLSPHNACGSGRLTIDDRGHRYCRNLYRKFCAGDAVQSVLPACHWLHFQVIQVSEATGWSQYITRLKTIYRFLFLTKTC